MIALFATNLLATFLPAATPSGGDLTRLADEECATQWVGTAGTVTIDVDLGTSPAAVSAWAVLNHNLLGVTLTLASGTSFPAGTTRDSANLGGLDSYRSFPAVIARYWRLTIPALAGSVAPAIGEFLLGTARTISDSPSLPTGYPAIVGNVARDRSPAGMPWNMKRGPARLRYAVEWNAMTQTDLTNYRAAYAETNEGADPVLFYNSADGAVLWTSWTDAEIAPEALGVGLFHVRGTFEEIPR